MSNGFEKELSLVHRQLKRFEEQQAAHITEKGRQQLREARNLIFSTLAAELIFTPTEKKKREAKMVKTITDRSQHFMKD